MPSRLGEEIPVPADRTVRLPRLDEARGSSFTSVSGLDFADSWARRNRAFTARGRLRFGHAWGGYVKPSPQLYATHPEWWARDREGNIRYYDKPTGSSVTNFCSTNPEVIEMVARKVNALFDAHPDRVIASLEPNDASPMCLCDRCLALDRRFGQADPDGTQVADRLLWFSQQIADRLEPRHRDKQLGLLIYMYQMEPPLTVRPHARHVAAICDMTWVYDHTRPFNDPTSPPNREFLRQLRGWRKVLSGEMGFYDYYGHWGALGPWPIVHKIREDLPAFREEGGTFVTFEVAPNFGMQGLNAYVAARLSWDVEADVDLLLEDYYTRFYGPAAEAMRRFWGLAEQTMALLAPGPFADRRFAAVPDIRDRLDECLKAAESAVSGPEVPPRFKARVALHRDGFDYGRFRSELDRKHNLIYIDGMGTGRDRSNVIDPDAAIAVLRAKKSWLDALAVKCKTNDPDRPPVVSPYFLPAVDRVIADIEAGKKGKTPRPLTEGQTEVPW